MFWVEVEEIKNRGLFKYWVRGLSVDGRSRAPLLWMPAVRLN
jgi:hypothetical protein